MLQGYETSDPKTALKHYTSALHMMKDEVTENVSDAHMMKSAGVLANIGVCEALLGRYSDAEVKYLFLDTYHDIYHDIYQASLSNAAVQMRSAGVDVGELKMSPILVTIEYNEGVAMCVFFGTGV